MAAIKMLLTRTLKRRRPGFRVVDWARYLTLTVGLMTFSAALYAALLPEERADAMYHSYDGGGVEITGPSVLVRKNVGESLSFSGNYYVDSISSASIDVVTSASAYSEERTETSGSVDFLHGKSLMSLGYTSSSESDYDASSAHFSIGQDLFGDLTTVTLGYSRGWDDVGRNGDPTFGQEVDRNTFRVGVSQILTPNAIFGVAWETVSDEGFLNNPYRQVRYVDAGNANGYSFEPEVYPRTRTSNALATRLRYYLPYRAALFGEYRFFNDTWGINSHNAEVGYTHPLNSGWIFDVSYRFYAQNSADFYSDLFPREQAQNYLARDKELSNFTSHSLGLGMSYEFAQDGWQIIDKGSLNFSYNYIRFNYEDFRDISQPGLAGEEPFYNFSANVWKAFISVWY